MGYECQPHCEKRTERRGLLVQVRKGLQPREIGGKGELAVAHRERCVEIGRRQPGRMAAGNGGAIERGSGGAPGAGGRGGGG